MAEHAFHVMHAFIMFASGASLVCAGACTVMGRRDIIGLGTCEWRSVGTHRCVEKLPPLRPGEQAVLAHVLHPLPASIYKEHQGWYIGERTHTMGAIRSDVRCHSSARAWWECRRCCVVACGRKTSCSRHCVGEHCGCMCQVAPACAISKCLHASDTLTCVH